MSAANRRMVREHNTSMTAAWHVAAFSRQKKMPKLDRVLLRMPLGRGRQTWEEQLQIMDSLMEAMRERRVN